MLLNDLRSVRINPYHIPERYFLHVRRILADPEVIPEVTVTWWAVVVFVTLERIINSNGSWVSGSMGEWVSGSMGQWLSGSMGHRSNCIENVRS